MKNIFNTTATFNGKYYDNFGIHPTLASMWGKKSEDVINLKFKISQDQTLPIKDNDMVVDYWGFYDFKKEDFTMIYPKRFLLQMCFAYGISAAEESGEGKAYRIEIIK